MKLAVIYTDRRGKYIAEGCAQFCEVVEIDLSGVSIKWWQKYISALVSFHLNRKLWQNEFYRNPLAVFFRKKNGNNAIKKFSKKVDAVLQFGLMNSYDYSLFGDPKIFFYLDGAYDPNNPYWYCPRFGQWLSGMQKKAYKQATRIFTFSKWAKRQHIEQCEIESEKIIDVGWGPCLTIEKKDKGFFNNPPHFVFVGRNSPIKGLDILISAFKIVQEKYPDVILNIAGMNSEEYSGDLTKGLLFHGYCEADKLKKILGSSDIFILPSRYERAGHVTIEAMSYGLVPIVTETCGAPEPVLAGKCGIIVPQEDIESLANAMISLIENPLLLKQLSHNATGEALKNWMWDKVCEKIVSVISKAS
ncbi:hypothetical protein BuS5_00054 [Desulfosarcina sp. BuS5]|nr:hypothetical protein BuS5_00054 [Desulfosarcina sp. BuS5]